MLQTFVVICVILIGIISAGDNAEYDYTFYQTGQGERGECEFTGYISNSGPNLCKRRSVNRVDFIQGGDLTWKILTDVCPDLIYAGCADPDWTDGPEHNMTRDLEWPSSCGSCPQCPCHNGEVDKFYLNNYTTFATSGYGFEVTQCVRCECEFFRSYYDENLDDTVTIYARDCDVGSSYSGSYRQFDSPDELSHVQCPYTTPKPTPQPTGGCEDGAGNNFAPGEYFFYYDEDNCDTYCTCNSTNGLDCQQGWDNILDGDERMRMEFLNDCGGYLDDAWDDPSRWYKRKQYCQNDIYFYSTQSTTAIYQCPINGDCGEYNFTEGWNSTTWWYGTYDDEEMRITTELYNCVTCQCDSDIYGENSTSTVTCNDVWQYGVKNESMCGVTVEVEDLYMNCSFDQNGNGKLGDRYTNIINGTEVEGRLRDVTLCSYPDNYCGWKKSRIPKGFDPDDVCIADELVDDGYNNDISWGCQDQLDCLTAFTYDDLQESTTGFCSFNEISFTAKEFDCIDFEWKSETYTIERNFMCCGKEAGNLCNDQIPSETALPDGCTASSGIDAFYKAKYECEYGDKGVTNTDYIKQLKCGVALPETSDVKGRVCDLIENRWKWSTTCLCQEYQAYEKAFGNSDYEDSLREYLQLDFDTEYSTLMVNLEEWNEYYECGKTFECDIYDSVDKLKMSILSIIFVVFVNFFM